MGSAQPGTLLPIDAERRELSRALDRATSHLLSVQAPSGAWAGEVVWNCMLTSQVVLAAHAIGRPLPAEDREAILRFLTGEQRSDGGFPLHPESEGGVFTTVLGYVAMRLLGVSAVDPRVVAAREALSRRGGVLGVPTWGKLWLALVGLYGWDGVNPVLPELWLLPEAAPMHPRRFYCHTRLIYLPMGVLYASRWTAPVTATIRELRDELYGPGGYERVDFARFRDELAASDLHVRPSLPLRAAYRASALVDRAVPRRVRRRAVARCIAQIRGELRATRYACISPVNGLLNVIALYAQDPHDRDLDPAWRGVEAWRWQDEGGARWVGARSDTWDTSFVAQALALRGAPSSATPLRLAADFLLAHQATEELADPAAIHRDPARGGFCFSDSWHRWPVSDTTAEAALALLALERRGLLRPPVERLAAAAEFILLRQNRDGGFGSYERRRGGALLEGLNPSEMFGACMTERSYVECTASCVEALAALGARLDVLDPALVSRIRQAVVAGRDRLLALQQDDGAWPAAWAVGTTYGTLFALRGLLHAGCGHDHPAVRRAVVWLEGLQRPDGTWGEHWTSCTEGRTVPHTVGHTTQTAWAVMALLLARAPATPASPAVERGVRALLRRQRPDGSWPHEMAVGVFFHTAVLDYRLYKDVFPTWALAMAEAARDQS